MTKVGVLISGKVQGVFYRADTKKKADELGLNGWVKNLNDGRVEAVFKGPKEKVDEMVKWCWKGSQNSRVSQVSLNHSCLQNGLRPVIEGASGSGQARGSQGKLEGFEIRY